MQRGLVEEEGAAVQTLHALKGHAKGQPQILLFAVVPSKKEVLQNLDSTKVNATIVTFQ